MSNPTAADLPLADADIATLGHVYVEALNSFADTATQLSPLQWTAISPCPGWTTADVVAHVIGIEREMHGEPLPNHEPDWAALPHADDLFSRYTEIPVDVRRRIPQDEVLAELRDVVAWRTVDIAGEDTDPAAIVIGPGGQRRTRDAMTRIRILDIWLHEQDLRAVLDSGLDSGLDSEVDAAAGTADGLGSDAAWVTADRLLAGMPRVWAKQVAAPVGAPLRLHVTGPGVRFDRTIVVDESGRAGLVTGLPPGPSDGLDHESATTAIEVPWPLFAALAAGRTGAVDLARDGGAHLSGDVDLATKFLESMSIMP